MPWLKAQANCRNQYTDLSPIISEEEETKFKQSSGRYNAWIGLYKDLSLESVSPQWKWSGGGVAYTNLVPNSFTFYNYARWTPDGCQLSSGSQVYCTPPSVLIWLSLRRWCPGRIVLILCTVELFFYEGCFCIFICSLITFLWFYFTILSVLLMCLLFY